MKPVNQQKKRLKLMTPLEKYNLDLQQDNFHHDNAQQQAVEHLDELYRRLTEPKVPLTDVKKTWRHIFRKKNLNKWFQKKDCIFGEG